MKQLVKESIYSTYNFIDDRPIDIWAKENVILPAGSFADAGYFDVSKSPYLKDIFAAFKDFSVNTIILLASPKLGKSMLADITIVWSVLNRPGNYQFYCKTAEQAKLEMKNHLAPLIRNCPCLEGFRPTDERDYTKNNIEFSTMQLNVNGCSIANLNQRDCQYVVCDESWEWADQEIEYARNRTLAFRETGNSKFIIITQGGLANSTLDQLYKQGDCSVYSVPCEKCNQFIQPEFEHIKFDVKKDKNKSYQWKSIFESIRFECPYCKHGMKDSKELKEYWNKNGKYIATNTNYINGVRSFRVNAIPTTKYSFEFLVEKFLRAKEAFNIEGNPEKLTDFNQQIMAKNVDVEELYDQRDQMRFYDYAISSNNKAVARFSIIDVQQSEDGTTPYYWHLVIEYDATGNSWVIWFGKQTTEQEILDIQKKYDIPYQRVFVDVGYNMGQTALWVAKNKWFGVKGDGNRFSRHFTWGNPPIKKLHSDIQYYPTGELKDGKQLVCQYFFLDSNGLKDLLDNIRKGKTQVKMHVPEGNGVFLEQMDSEYWVRVPRNGRIIKEWKQKRNRPNHAWDCCNYALAIALLYEHRIKLLNNLYPSNITITEEIETSVSGSIT